MDGCAGGARMGGWVVERENKRPGLGLCCMQSSKGSKKQHAIEAHRQSSPLPTSPHHLRSHARATAGSALKMDTGMARSLVGAFSGLVVEGVFKGLVQG